MANGIIAYYSLETFTPDTLVQAVRLFWVAMYFQPKPVFRAVFGSGEEFGLKPAPMRRKEMETNDS